MRFQFSRRTKIVIYAAVAAFLIFSIYLIRGISINTHLTISGYVPTGHYPGYPAMNLKDKTTEQIAEIKRGEYLVKAGDCIACHSAPGEGNQAFAGGLPMQTPFGVVYSQNITPDKETGIGSWSDQDFIRAFHEGISPQGEYYYPAFPYYYFSQVTVADVLAIRAYLNSIPAVKHPNHSNSMIFPFNWRFLQLGWRILFFYPNHTGPYQNDAAQSAKWNRGKYLVEGLGHCAMCHTPSYYLIVENVSLGAPIRKYHLTGAVVEGYLAPNITKSNLGAIPDQELLKVFKQYEMIGGNAVQGPMSEAIHDSLELLTDDDLLAIIAYMKSVESTIPVQPAARATDVGKVIYDNYCSGCHNSGVGGAPRIDNAAGWEALANSGLKKLYNIAIHGGGNMPAKGTCITCSDYQVTLAVDYMVSESQKKSKSAKTSKGK